MPKERLLFYDLSGLMCVVLVRLRTFLTSLFLPATSTLFDLVLLSATSGRSGQPPPTGWFRHSAVLVSPRRAADPHPLGDLLAASTPFAGRSQRGLLAGLRNRGLRPAHSCGVDAQRLLLAASTPFGLVPIPLRHSKLPVGVPSGTAEAGDPKDR